MPYPHDLYGSESLPHLSSKLGPSLKSLGKGNVYEMHLDPKRNLKARRRACNRRMDLSGNFS